MLSIVRREPVGHGGCTDPEVMNGRRDRANREEECEQILDAYDADRFEISEAFDAQFQTLHNRAQVLLAICGVLLTASVLAMTGKMIARPDLPHLAVASRLIVAAGASDMLAAAVAIGWVLRIRWVSPPPTDLHAWVLARLAYRDRKTRALHTSITCLLLAMLLYQAAAIIVLLQL